MGGRRSGRLSTNTATQLAIGAIHVHSTTPPHHPSHSAHHRGSYHTLYPPLGRNPPQRTHTPPKKVTFYHRRRYTNTHPSSSSFLSSITLFETHHSTTLFDVLPNLKPLYSTILDSLSLPTQPCPFTLFQLDCLLCIS